MKHSAAQPVREGGRGGRAVPPVHMAWRVCALGGGALPAVVGGLSGQRVIICQHCFVATGIYLELLHCRYVLEVLSLKNWTK